MLTSNIQSRWILRTRTLKISSWKNRIIEPFIPKIASIKLMDFFIQLPKFIHIPGERKNNLYKYIKKPLLHTNIRLRFRIALSKWEIHSIWQRESDLSLTYNRLKKYCLSFPFTNMKEASVKGKNLKRPFRMNRKNKPSKAVSISKHRSAEKKSTNWMK